MRTIKNYLLYFSMLFFLVQCNKDQDGNDLRNLDPSLLSEYSVYSAILNQGFEKIKKPLVIQQTSDKNSPSFYDNVFESYVKPEGIQKILFDDVLNKSDSIFDLDNNFNIAPRKVQLITLTQLQAAFMVNGVQGSWEDFYKKFPDSGGYIRFSRVAFNDSENEAFVEYAHVYQGLGADGGFIYLEKVGDKWYLRKFINVWVS